MSRLIALTLLISSAAYAQFAQPLTLTFPGNTETVTFSGADCGGRTTLGWQVSRTTQACNQLKLFVTSATTCTKDPVPGDYDLGAETINTGITSGTKTIEFNKLPGLANNTDGGVGCGDAAERSWKVCGFFEANSAGSFGFCTTKQDVTDSVPVTYDGKPPAVPSLEDATGVERGIRVRAAASNDANLVRFGTRVIGDLGPYNFATETVVEGEVAEARIDELSNGVEYEVTSVSVDAAGNVSGESNVITAIPTETLGFWDAYKRAGGSEQGGCASVTGLIPAAAIMFGIWISRRRRS